jgi:penicillin-binding protein 1B
MGVTVAKAAAFLRGHRREALIAGAGLLILAFFITYVRFSRLVEQRLNEGVFASTIGIYAAPKTIAKGNPATQETLVTALRRAGYSERADAGAVGQYRLAGDSVTIMPGPASYLHGAPVRVLIGKGRIASLSDTGTGKELARYDLDPQLLSNLSGSVRERRRLIRHGEMPKVLVDALLAAEDRNFYSHSGFDVPRIAKAAWANLTERRRGQGGSTLTMQLARNIWLTPQKTWRRKITELLIALILERKLTKDQILEHYANQAYLGNHDSYEIHGFGEAAWRYFNRDVGQLTLTQAALLAGMIQRPNYFDPERHPERARERRNLILTMMRRNGAITQEEMDTAHNAPLDINPRSLDRSEAPYFVDLALNQAQQIPSASGGSVKLYTTVDPELQADAAEAVRIGMERLDKIVAKKEGFRQPVPQVALIALDAQTGQVKAAIGGRNYGESQLNRVLAKRQPGSAFKPFVYATALESQLGKRGKIFTGATLLDDQPTTFTFGDEIYEPGNFGDTFRGPVLLRRALTSSLNVPTVALAQAVGYKRVAELARRVGLQNVRGTPAAALGAYDATPLEIAGAYTVFPNDGKYIEPTFLEVVQSADGKELYHHQVRKREALDPRINWLMVDMLQDVLKSGTGGGVWSYGLRAPAAGKTGTSRDGWFAGFTTGLICVVWTGYDDNRDLDLEGAKSALPVWAEFMKRATAREYSKPFANPPSGLVSEEIDADTGELASGNSAKTRTEFFLTGNEPKTAATAESIEAVRIKREEELPALLEARAEELGPPGSVKRPVTLKTGGQIGLANWYRPKSGDEMVAFSPVLASGMKVKVTNVATGRSVVVTIAGRIPAESGYVISLAQRAASELDFLRSGSAQVRVETTNR